MWRMASNDRASQDRDSAWDQASEHHVDGAESRPQHSTGEINPTENWAEATESSKPIPRPSVSSTSATGQGSSNPAHESEAVSAPPSNEQDSSRPTDDQIIAQENEIRQEAERLPFVGDLEPILALQQEYQSGSAVFVAKIKKLETMYKSIRRARGDGNCFFRSFIFAYMESLVHTADLTERNRVVTCIRQWKQKMVDHGYQELVFEDAMEVIIDQLNALGTQDPLTVQSLEGNMRDGMISNMVIMFLRMLTSCEIQRRQDFFAPFIMGMLDDPVTVEQFCRRYVEPMGEESDHIHIVAITDALQIPIRVVYLDRSMAAFAGAASEDAAAVNHHDFVPEAMQKAAAVNVQPRVHLLYRPGHYDILYPRPTS